MNPFCCSSVEDTLEINGDDKSGDHVVGDQAIDQSKESSEDSSSDGLSDSAEKVVLDVFEKIGVHRGDLEPVLSTRKGVTFAEKIDQTSESPTSKSEQEVSAEIQATHPKSPEENPTLPSLLPSDEQSQELKPETFSKEKELIESANPLEDDANEAVAEENVLIANAELHGAKSVEIQSTHLESPQEGSSTPILQTSDDGSQELNEESPEGAEISATEPYERDNHSEHSVKEVAEEESVDAEIEFVLKEPSTTDAEGGEDNDGPASLAEYWRAEAVSPVEREHPPDDEEQARKSLVEDPQEDSVEARFQSAEECLAPPESAFDLNTQDSGNVSGSEDFEDAADLSNFDDVMVPDEDVAEEEPVTLGSDIHEAAALVLLEHGDDGSEDADARPTDFKSVGNHVISAIALSSKSDSPVRDPPSGIQDVSQRPSSAKGKRRFDI